jgi:hypothetical protein
VKKNKHFHIVAPALELSLVKYLNNFRLGMGISQKEAAEKFKSFPSSSSEHFPWLQKVTLLVVQIFIGNRKLLMGELCARAEAWRRKCDSSRKVCEF